MRNTCTSVVESLEARRFLTVSGLTASFDSATGILAITGTESANVVNIDLAGNLNGTAKVTVKSGVQKAMVFNAVKIVTADLLGGNDRVAVSGTVSADSYIPVIVHLGNGADLGVINKFNGVVDMSGDAGNDVLTAATAVQNGELAGTRILHGGLNNDSLIGSASVDNLLGDDGNDTVFGGDGNDILNGGRGTNWLYGQGGDDTFVENSQTGLFAVPPGDDNGAGGTDYIFGGCGPDTLVQVYNSSLGTPVFGATTFSVEAITLVDIG